MSQFCVRLKEYIELSGKTIYHLAQKAGVNRPMIHKSIKGDIVPNEKFIERLSISLMLSENERKELFDLAERARIGEAAYCRHCKVEQILNNVPLLEIDYIQKNERNRSVFLNNINQYLLLNSQQEIKNCLLEMININELFSHKKDIIFYVPSHSIDLCILLYQLTTKKEARLFHYVALEKDYAHVDSVSRNLEIVSLSMQMAMKFEEQYQCNYFYQDYPESQISSGMPYFVRIPQVGVLRMNSKLTFGAYYKEGEMTHYVDGFIKERNNHSESLITCENNFFLNTEESEMAVFQLQMNENNLDELSMGSHFILNRNSNQDECQSIVISAPRELFEKNMKNPLFKNFVERNAENIFIDSNQYLEKSRYDFIVTKKHEVIMYLKNNRQSLRIHEPNTSDVIMEYLKYSIKRQSFEAYKR